jgi:hypothetical protein
MPDQTQNNSQQTMVYALVAIAVLLAAIVGFMIYQRTAAIPAPTAATTAAPVAAGGSSSTAAPAGMTAAAPVEFDAKSATKLPSGMTPEQALKAYNEAIMANKFDKAFELLPLAQKTSYGTPDAMGTQIKQYGITGYKIGKPVTNGSDVTIVAEQDTPAMNITYTWTYTKVDGQWFLKSRTMGGTL